MKNHDLTFGAGKRVCMGKSVSILETYKVMTTLFLTYEVIFQSFDPSATGLILVDELCGSIPGMAHSILLVHEANWNRREDSKKV